MPTCTAAAAAAAVALEIAGSIVAASSAWHSIKNVGCQTLDLFPASGPGEICGGNVTSVGEVDVQQFGGSEGAVVQVGATKVNINYNE